ncbi:MAG TPA: FtsX-like permease family protein [Pseudobdellovibrionaceae bacterium]|nr:FtsX-like permease family protein [Pseudobdellovibrionaceae bacterium]
MRTLFVLAWKNLFRNVRRTSASLITVAFGSAGLLIYQGFNSGLMNQYRENTVRGYYGYGQVFPKGYYGSVYEKPWEHWIVDPAGMERKIKSVPQVKEVFPRIGFYAFVVRGGLTLGGKGEGIVPERENAFFTQKNIIDGRDLAGPDEIILGKGLADALGVKADDTVTVLTQTVHGQLNGADMKVAGVFHMGIKSIDDQFFRVALESAQQLLDTDKIEMFSLSTTGVDDWTKIRDGIVKAAPNLEPISFDVLDKVYYQNSVDFLNAQFNVIRTIILFIVALGIFNTIAVGLLERAGEVGALRANGETRSRLFRVLLLENALLGFLGGILGIVIAVILDYTIMIKGIPMPPAPGITRSYLIFLQIQPEHYIQALMLPMLAAVVASILPVRKLLSRSIPDLLRSV